MTIVPQHVEHLALVEAVFAAAARRCAMAASSSASTTSFCDSFLARRWCARAFRVALPTTSWIASRKGARSGALLSDVIGMYGVVMFSRMLKRVLLLATAMV